jgi:hypothetical protein
MFDQILSMRKTRTASLPQLGLVGRAIFSLTVMSALAAMHPMTTYGGDPADRPSPAERHAASIVNGRRLQPTCLSRICRLGAPASSKRA